jgi:hypothetical protein
MSSPAKDATLQQIIDHYGIDLHVECKSISFTVEDPPLNVLRRTIDRQDSKRKLISFAVENSRYDVLQHIIDALCDCESFILDSAILMDDINVLKWLHLHNILIIEPYHVDAIMEFNRYDMLDWILDEQLFDFNTVILSDNIYRSISNVTILTIDLTNRQPHYRKTLTVDQDAAFEMETISKLNYFEDKGLLSNISTGYFLYNASYNGHLNILDWFFDHRDRMQLMYDDLCVDMTGYDQLNALQWWYDKRQYGLEFKYSVTALHTAIKSDNLKIVKWWFAHADELEIKYDPIIIDVCSHEMLDYLFKEQCVIPSVLYTGCIDITDSVTLLDWLLCNQHIIPFEYTSAAMDLAYSWKLNWFWSRRNQLELKYTSRAIDRICDTITRIGFQNELQFWFDHRKDLQLKFTPDLLQTFIHRDFINRAHLLLFIQ